MNKYSFLFHNVEECEKAEQWIRANIDDIEEYARSYDGVVLAIYRAVPLSDRQKEIIKDATRPASFLEGN
jgi:hypothetical protein